MNFTREPSGNLHSFRTKSETYYYLTDALGTVEAVANSQGKKANWYYYSPNGITDATEQVPQPYRFAGGYQDPTGLYHNKARYLDPNIGRFTQPDPAGLEANPYLYASGDPTNIIDPTGLFGWSDIGEGLGGAVGTVVGVAATAALCSTGVGCIVAGAVIVGLSSGSGAAIGSAALGGNNEDRTDAFINGTIWGALGATPASAWLGRYL
ncbi:RHS repeat-associated core domain-containing protein [Streptomyces sp. NPDC051954]|uniref:RHS repeat-associated core domain-containing protein n=1 Tax=Streptomyces sp. NPDC051954 TaxID=3155524 RepID=UPI003427006B